MSRAAVVALPPWRRSALIATGLLLGWCVVRGAANDLWSVDAPERAALFWPASGDALAAIAQARIVAAGGRVDARSRTLIGAALGRAPRSADPLILAGLDASARGDLGRAERLMTAARARDPRATIARSWLLDHFMRTGDYAAGLGEVGAELRLRPDSQGPVLAILSALLATPKGARALRDALARDPDWRQAFFTTTPHHGADPAALAALLSSIPPAHDRAAAEIEQSAVLRALIDRGDYAGAYRSWLGLLPPRYRGASAGIYDPEFSGWPGATPFNWYLQSDAASGARIAPADGRPLRHFLSLAFGGDSPAVLAEQYQIVAPGDYLFSLVARQTGDGATRLVARLVCAADASVLATLPLESFSQRFAARTVAVTVPVRCGAVRVQFAGVPGDARPSASVQIAAVRLAGR